MFTSTMKRKWYFSIIFIHSCFYMFCCKIIGSRIDLKLKVRTAFPNEYKYQAIPTIHSITVLWDSSVITNTSGHGATVNLPLHH